MRGKIMNIFIDIDNTLYQNRSVSNRILNGEFLLEEATAPLFDGAKETMVHLSTLGHKCFAVTQRGLISEEELLITYRRLREAELFAAASNHTSPILAVVGHVKNKYAAINKVYNEYLKTDLDNSQTILIDDDLQQVAECAASGIRTIWFAPQTNETPEEKNFYNDHGISIAHSWKEIKDLILANQTKEERE